MAAGDGPNRSHPCTRGGGGTARQQRFDQGTHEDTLLALVRL